MSWPWNLLIGLVTVCSILAMLWLLIANARGTPGESTGHVWDDDLREYNNPLPRWWLNLFVLTIVFGLGYLILYPGLGTSESALGWSQERQLKERLAAVEARRGSRFEQFRALDLPALVASPEARALGRQVFMANCTGCHGQDARGALGFPDLTDAQWIYGADADSVLASVRDGRGAPPRVMPAHKDRLAAEEVRLVAAHVLGLSQRP